MNTGQKAAQKREYERRIKPMIDRFNSGEFDHFLKAMPHPDSDFNRKGKTLRDYIEWSFTRGKHTQQMNVVRQIEAILGIR